jgi:hypothetical protein
MVESGDVGVVAGPYRVAAPALQHCLTVYLLTPFLQNNFLGSQGGTLRRSGYNWEQFESLSRPCPPPYEGTLPRRTNQSSPPS